MIYIYFYIVQITSKTLKEIGLRLRKIREEKRMSQTEIAQSMKMLPNQYNKVENGKRCYEFITTPSGGLKTHRCWSPHAQRQAAWRISSGPLLDTGRTSQPWQHCDRASLGGRSVQRHSWQPAPKVLQ